MEFIKDFIEDKGVYLVIILSIGIVSLTIAMVGYRDYGNVQNDDGELLAKEEKNEPVVGQAVIINDGEKLGMIEVEEDYENIRADVEEKSKEIANEMETVEDVEEEKFLMPVDGEIIKGYSTDELVYSNTLKEWKIHEGIDIRADAGTAVKAVADGTVIAVAQDELYGTTITIKHSDDLQSVYSNLSTISMVKIGDKVKRGDALSGVGDSSIIECLDEPHLHFEMQKGNESVNPLDYINYTL